jgi:hypothetical protein
MKTINFKLSFNSKLFYFILFPLLLLFPAIYNSYPLVFSDTGTYIRSGFEFSIPADRPVFYGLFLKHSSLGLSFWLSIFLQALLSCFALWQLIQQLSSHISKNKITEFFIFTFCLVFSSLPYYSSILLSDFALAPALIFLFLFYYEKSESKSRLYAFSILLLSLFHLSLLMTLFLMMILCWFLYLTKIVKFQFLKIKQITFIILGSFILLIGTNYWVSKKAQITPSGHLFLTAKFIEKGLYKKVLEDNCQKMNWVICKYKDSLPVYGSDFLWLENSILYKMGGWNSNVEEYKTINSKIINPGKYTLDLAQVGLTGFKKQILMNQFGGEILNNYNIESPPGQAIHQFMKHEIGAYAGSKQNNGLLNKKWLFIWNEISYYCLCLMLISSILQLLFYKHNPVLSNYILLIISYLIFQDIFIGTFSIEDARYNSRILWLFIPAGLLSFEGILRIIKNHYVVYLSNKTRRS